MKTLPNFGHLLTPAIAVYFILLAAITQAQEKLAPVNAETATAIADTLALSPLAFEAFLADSLQMDSARKVQKNRQANLRREINALSRTPLGSESLEWHQSMDIEVERAGRSVVQRFWFDDKLQEGPFIWFADTLRNDEWLWFDAEERRMATLFLNSNQGNYISRKLAEMSRMMGNGTEVAKKKASKWKVENKGEPLRYVLETEQGTYTLALGSKSISKATAMVNWLKLQPIEALTLPVDVKKRPIESLELRNSEGLLIYAFKIQNTRELEPAFTIDPSSIQINDPERSLNVIARERAEKKKLEETSE